MPYPKGYLTHQQVRRLKAIPTKGKTGAPNLAAQVRDIGGEYEHPEPSYHSQDLFISSDEEEEDHHSAVEEEEDSDTDTYYTAPSGTVASSKVPKKTLNPRDINNIPYHIDNTVGEPLPGSVHDRDKRDAPSMSGKRSADTSGDSGSEGPSAAKSARSDEGSSSGGAHTHAHHMGEGAGSASGSGEFGQYTSPEGQHFTTFRKNYSKTFRCYCMFDGVSKCEVNTKAGDHDCTITINHGGHTFPYWRRLAFTNPEDFNQPNNVIGFRCTRMGFNVPRMEVSTCPNSNMNDQCIHQKQRRCGYSPM